MDILIVTGIFCVIFPLFWCAIIFLISRIGGWASLAGHYGYSGETKSPQRKWRSLSLIRLRLFPSNYSFIVKMSADDQALYLSLMTAFRVGHAPLRIPIRDLSLSDHKVGFANMGHLYTAKAPGIQIAMRPSDIKWIETASGGLKRQ